MINSWYEKEYTQNPHILSSVKHYSINKQKKNVYLLIAIETALMA